MLVTGRWAALVLLFCAAWLAGCGGPTSSSQSAVRPASDTPVIVVVEENHSFREIIGNPAMPFVNSLAQQYSLAANYFANAHPSMPNYFEMTSGQTVGDNGFRAVVDVDNVVRQLTASGRTWKVYIENFPHPGFLGDSIPGYDRDHNPFPNYSDVANDPAQAANLVPFSQFPGDLASGTLPNYSFIIPANAHNGHDCPDGPQSCSFDSISAAADNWLKSSIGPVISSSQFNSDGLLAIVWDESIEADIANGGGHVPLILVGPGVKRGFVSQTMYQHQSLLRLTLEKLGVHSFPGAAASAAGMSEFFQ